LSVAAATEALVLDGVERHLLALGEDLPHMRAGMVPYLKGGKRLRARLLVGIGSRGESVITECLIRYATFVELVHAGGLCHDDVVDRSETRRGTPSIGNLYGVPAAARGGLYLMARAHQLIAGDDDRVRTWVADAAMRVARGQAREMTDLYRDDISIDEYLRRADDKTAALFELAARLGAAGGGFDDREQSLLAAYGARIGLAFQLADDLRDVVGGPALGRERGTDIREGVYTLPVILTLAERRAGWRNLRRAMRIVRLHRDQAAVDACCEMVTANGGLRAAAGIMRCHLQAALETAHQLPGRLRPVLCAFAGKVAYGLDGTGEAPAA
jgi:geranylgeranyl pyrophosphate synthase